MQPLFALLHLHSTKPNMKLSLNRTKSLDSLLEGCRRRKPKVQRELYERYAPLFLGISSRYIKDRGEAEEVMIGAFTKIFQKVDQFGDQGSFEGWMKRIVVNESLMYVRKNKSLYLHVDLEMAEREPNYSYLENELEAQDLRKVIDLLPDGYKMVFNLYAIEGYSHKEIAEQLGVSINTSKSQLSRARSWLKNQLIEMESDIKQRRYSI